MPDAPTPAADRDDRLREHVAWLIEGGYAHDSLRDVLSDMPVADFGRVPPGTAHSAWQIIEHVRICQRDLIDYSLTPGHVSPDFPDGLWPDDPRPPSATAVADTLDAIEADRAELVRLVRDPSVDVLAPRDFIDGRTILRQALITVEHLSYHVGQLSISRATLSAGPSADA